MIKKAKLSLLTISVLAALGAQAQGLPEPLIQAARQAVASSPEVAARWNGFKASANERDVARGGLLPQLDLTTSLGRESRVSPSRLAGGGYNTNATQLTLSQMLFDGMFTPSEVKRLGFARLTRYYELAEASETAALEAVRAYADVVRYRELVDIATDNYAEHKQITAQVEERANAGVGRQVDVEQATGRLAKAESNLLTELTNLHDVGARYLRIVGEKPPASLPRLAEPFKLGTLPATTAAVIRVGLQGSPTVNAAVENVRASTMAIESRKAAYLPRLELRANTGISNGVDGILGNTRVSGVQLVLNYNLFRGGADQARERQSVNLSEQARDLQEKACRDVRQTLSIAYNDVRSLSEQQRYLNQYRLSTEKSREAYRQQFDIGQRTLLDMLDNQNEYFEATRAYINARHNQALAQARTLAGMGQLVAALGVSRDDVPNLENVGQDRSGISQTELCRPEDLAMDTLEQIKQRAVVVPRRRAALPPPPPKQLPPSALATALLPAALPASALVLAAAKVNLPAVALFDFGKAELKAAGLIKLDRLLIDHRGAPLDVVIAVGQTATVRNDAYNQALSLARAKAVKAYLVSKGADVKRVRAVDIGEGRSVAETHTN